MPLLSTELDACRVCGDRATLGTVLELGPQRLSAFPVAGTPLHTVPLDLLECGVCGAVQLSHTTNPARLFQDEYWYASGINGMMREELRNVVREARGWVKVRDNDWVLDIGANDGTLLNAWREHAWEGRPHRMAVEPSPTFTTKLSDVAELVVPRLFPIDIDPDVKFKVITSIAMFYAVPNPVEFAAAVRDALTDDGIWVVQMQDLQNMVRATAFDNICHEHLLYYTVSTFGEVCRRAGLEIVSVQPREINGGSLRFIVQKQRTAEYTRPPIRDPKIDWPAFEEEMAHRLASLSALVSAANDYGHAVDILGASTKGNTLLQLAGLGPHNVRQAWERHPNKFGRMTVTGIPIVDEVIGRQSPPGLLVCPIWQFRHGVIEREHEYLRGGGRIYFPLPEGEMFSGQFAGVTP